MLLGFAAAGTLRAQASPPIDPLERVYRDVERLAAIGVIDDVVLGQRPFSRREIIRLLTEAQNNLATRGPSGGGEWMRQVIAADLARIASYGTSYLDRADVEQSVMDSPDRRAPSDLNGSIDARINPLTSYREGRPLYDGSTTIVETHHSVNVGRHLAVWAAPIFSVGARRGDGATSQLALQSGGARGEFGNFVVQLARDYEMFGESPTGGSVVSTNAPALDALTITNDRPARLPFFGWLGPMRGTLFVADLGPHQNFPHAKLAGWKVSILPHPNFEFALHVESQTGGDGGPAASFVDRALDLVPPIGGLRNLFSNGAGNTDFSNKFAGFDVRLRIPRARGLDIYGNAADDDFDARRLGSSLFSDGGVVAGVSMSCLLECGRLGVRAEYHLTGIRYYTHTQFTSGYALNGTLLGDPLGPRGNAGTVAVDGESERFGTLALEGAFEIRSGNRYAGTADQPNDRNFHFVLIEQRPGEKRTRATLTWIPTRRDARIGWRMSAAAERAINYAFVAGHDRTNALAQIQVEFRP